MTMMLRENAIQANLGRYALNQRLPTSPRRNSSVARCPYNLTRLLNPGGKFRVERLSPATNLN